MPRLSRLCPIGIPQHIIQRGNNRQVCFSADEDMVAYANWLLDYATKYEVHIHAWVFMTNHVHILVTPYKHLHHWDPRPPSQAPPKEDID